MATYTKTNWVDGTTAITAARLNNIESGVELAVNNTIAYALTTGTTNSYAVTLTPAPGSLTDGLALAIKVHIDNTGASTLNINGLGAKPIKKGNSSDVSAGNLKASSIYTLRYNGTNFCLQGEGGSGTALPGDVITGKTFTNDIGDQTGTLTDRAAYTTATSVAVDQSGGTTYVRIPQGAYRTNTTSGYPEITVNEPDINAANIKAGVQIFDVTGNYTSDANANASDILNSKTAYVNGNKVTGTIPVRSGEYLADNYTLYNTGTEQRVYVKPPQGYYTGQAGGGAWTSGNACYLIENNLTAANIKTGTSILGISGALTEKKMAKGTAVGTQRDAGGFLVIDLTINTLTFRPRTIVLWGYYSSMMGVYTYTEEMAPNAAPTQNAVCYRSNSSSSSITGNLTARLVTTTINNNGFGVAGLDASGFRSSISWLAIG